MSKRRTRRQRLPVDPVTLEIESLSHEGRGVAHIEGKVAFVEGALPGETVQAIYQRRRSQLDELRCQEVISAATERVTAPCQYADICGGCSLQHLAPTAQLAFKEKVLLEHLQHAAGIAPEQFQVLPQMTGPSLHYRRKARLAVRVVRNKGGVLVGFREKGSSFITDMLDCQILESEVAVLISPLRELINSLDRRYDIPQIEVAIGELVADLSAVKQVALVIRHLQPLTETDLQALSAFAADKSLHLYLQPAGNDSVWRLYPERSEFPQRLFYYLPDQNLRLAFHPMDFTQINGAINRQIINQTLEKLALNSQDRVLDLFCGLGNFTLAIARHAGHVTGVEGSEEMVERGTENALANEIHNTAFFAADLSKSIADRPWAQATYDKIVLDPPRSGAAEIIPLIAGMGASRIVYVSCNPITLARDAGLLLQHGYELKSAGVMDMFPHTTHVESMAVFEQSA